MLLSYLSIIAQTGINNNSPRAALDVSYTNSGIILPNSTLANLSTQTITNPQGGNLVDGTLTYSTHTTNKGIYYWQNSLWNKFNEENREISSSNKSTTNNTSHSISQLGNCSALTNVGTNTQVESFDISTKQKTFDLSSLSGTVCNVTINIKLKHTWPQEIDMYLRSPSGKILELCTDNGPSGRVTIFDFNVTFSDLGTNNITSWSTTGNISGTYKPEGSLTSDGYTPNITNFAGFTDDPIQGVWTLIIRDDVAIDMFDFESATLNISYKQNIEATYELIAQQSINTLSNKNVLATSNFSSTLLSTGLQTVITRTTNLQTNTTTSTLPGTILSVSNATANNNNWVNLYNQNLDESLNNNTVYYYQLWSKGRKNSTEQQYSFHVTTINK